MARTPKPAIKRHGHPKWPWATMKVGDFFFVERDRNTMTALAWSSGKRLGRKFSTRMLWVRQTHKPGYVLCSQDSEGAVYGVGVWREQ